MTILKSVLGAVVGGTIGVFVGIPIAGLAWIPVRLVTRRTDLDAVAFGVTWIVLVSIGIIVGFRGPIKEKAKRQAQLDEQERRNRLAQEEDARRKKEHRDTELKHRIDRLSDLLASSERSFLDLRELIPAAERHLELAQGAFDERAFSPFWDEIESATNSLAAYQHGIELINSTSIAYREEAALLPTSVPSFNLQTRRLPDGRPTASRLATSVRAAQRDFQFATIFEQRKTNQILVAGFGTLASTIYALGDSISSSLSDLSFNLNASLGDLLAETRESSRRTQSAATRHVDLLIDQSKRAQADAASRRQFEREVASRQEEQSRMLNNIQRGRRPLI